MRRVSLILGAITLFVLIFPAPSTSQVTYIMNASAPFDYVSGTEAIISWVGGADDGYFDLSLGDFVFQFYEVPVTTLRISTNGYMTVGEEQEGGEFINYPIPNSTPPNPVIAPFWTDLNLVSGQVRWGIFGTSPLRELVVEWLDVPYYSAGWTFSFEAIFYESTNKIKFQYSNVTSGIPYTVGVEDFDGASGSQFSYNNSSVSNGLAIEFIPKRTRVFFDDFSTDKGWTGYEPGTGWERGFAVPGGGENGNPDPGADHSSTTDNYILGFVIGGDYQDNLPEKSIISPAINCSELSQVFLKFWRHLNVDSNTSDHARIYVSNDGANWTPFWENPVFTLTDNQWIPVVLDISSMAANQETVYIKFSMGLTNATGGRYSGWNIDDLEVTSLYSGSLALYVPSGGIPNPNINELLIENSLGIRHSNTIPSDLSDYDLLIVSDNAACDSTTANYIKNFVLSGAGVIIMSGTPHSLAGNSNDLSSIKDWFGAGLYGNDGGYATVAFDNPFGTDLLANNNVDYSIGNSSAAIYSLESEATLLSKWSSNGVHSFYYPAGQGRVFYYAGNPGYPEVPDSIIAENGLILFEAGLFWATGCTLPTIISQPQSQSIQSGQTATMWVGASGTMPIAYQWYQGSSGDTSNPISGAVSDLYTTPALTEAASYWVRVTNPCGVVDSNTATITIGGPCTAPNITAQPQSQTIASGQTASLSVSASGTTPFYYLWYEGLSGDTSNPIPGAITGLYTTPPLTQTMNYWVRVTNPCGVVDSNTATITIGGPCTAPNITAQPQSQTVGNGQTASISVSADGTTPISYQWYQGPSGDTSNPINGATSSSYTTPALTQTTSYWAAVTNSCGSVNSNAAVITVATAGISVVSANGGETWSAGSAQTIRWSYFGAPGNYVKIELLKGGVVNATIAPSVPKGVGGSGFRNWTVPANQTPGIDYRIRITSTTNGAYTDTSDSDFTVAAPTLTVVSPNGGETWPAGSTQTIRWDYTGNPGSYVKIELLKGGVLNRTIVPAVSKGREGSGYRNWTIPATQTPGTDYTIRVTSTTDSAYTDTTDTDFTIAAPTLTVISPNGGETWPAGSTQTIRWDYTGNPGSYVKIELLKGGVLNRTIVPAVSKGREGSGYRNWTIPATQTPGTDYTIRVTSTTDGAYTDTTDTDFTIAAPTITVVSPNGGETWPAGSIQAIRWSYAGNPGNYVKIELLKGEIVTSTIASSVSKGTGGSGSRNWTIPANQVPGADYRIRIMSTTNGTYADTSDSDFSIQ